MAEPYSESPERLPRESHYRFLESVLGDLVLRPWFDWVALNSVARGYFPLSRAWAAAMASGGSLARFQAELALDELPKTIVQPALMLVQNRRAAFETAAAAWEQAFFGQDDPRAAVRVEAETRRYDAAHQLMLTRFAFLPFRGRLPSVRWEVASPAEVEAAHGARLAEPAAAFPAPALPEITVSRPVLSAYGREYWLRYPAPVAGDTAWARVVEPEHIKDPPTVIFLHGIAMETEMWRHMAGPVDRLFTADERAYAEQRRDPTERYAVRFAAKEAAMKAMGLGIGAFPWRDVEVVRADSGAPSLVLHRRAAAVAREHGVSEWRLTLSHTATVAQAVALAL